MKYVVKFAAEITIKTRPVRKQFSLRLLSNIRRIFKRRGIDAQAELHWDLIQVVASDQQAERVAAELQSIPGIAHFLQVVERALPPSSDDSDAEDVLASIASSTEKVLEKNLRGRTFVVRCKRQGKHNFTSHDVERYVGGLLLRSSGATGVRMRDADITVNLQIKQNRLFIVQRRFDGLGGYPLGCVGPVLSLMSGGYDSSVASYETTRRGMQTYFCFFNLGGHAHEVGVKQVSHYLWDRFGSSHRVLFISVPFIDVVGNILANISNPYMGVVLKRMMYRVASRLADHLEIDAIATGECVSQVSSQTLRNLVAIDAVTDKLVLRPLSTWDKTSIIHRAADIGVATYAEHMPEYCAVISDKPTTAAKMAVLEREESAFDFALLDDAIERTVMTAIDKVYDSDVGIGDVEMQALPQPGQIVVDLRHDSEQEEYPLVLHGNQTLHIPFYKINSLFSDLDPAKEYLLYCDRGVMSRLHAAHLRAEGFDNVKVYRPAP